MFDDGANGQKRRGGAGAAGDLVEVLYSYESSTARGHTITVRPGERFLLVSAANRDWWYVAKRQAAGQSPVALQTDAFYLPSSYVRRLHHPSTVPAQPYAGPSGSKYRTAPAPLSVSFSGTADSGSGGGHSFRRAGSKSQQQKQLGFRLADPNRISRSIPGNLDFVHSVTADMEANLSRRSVEVEPAEDRLSNGVMDESQASSSFAAAAGDDQLLLSSCSADKFEENYENTSRLSRQTRPPPIELLVGQQPLRVLPDGWEEYADDEGRVFFYHPLTKLTRWKPPRLLIGPSEVAAIMSAEDTNSESDVSMITERSAFQSTATNRYSLRSPPPLPIRKVQNRCKNGEGASLSVTNRGYGMGQNSNSFDAFACSEDLAAAVISASEPIGSPSSSPVNKLHSPLGNAPSLAGSYRQNSIKYGTLEKCKSCEAGRPLHKKTWSNCYVYLTSAHLLFYKDERSSEKRGNHYTAPLGVCDLRGGSISWYDEDKRRKHVFQLELIDGTTYLFSLMDMQEINSWYHAIRQVIAKLPRPDFYPTPVIEDVSAESPRGRKRNGVGGNSAMLIRSTSALTTSSSSSSPATTKKHNRKSVVIPTEGAPQKLSATPAKQSILDKLVSFFRSRPSIETLKEKGIYKPEPVFGSSLTEIANREKNNVSKFLEVCTQMIEVRGLDADGLYRISGNLSQVQKIRCQVDQDKYTLLISEDDVHVLTGALKLFFRELQEPLFPSADSKHFFSAIRTPKEKDRLAKFAELLKRLPPPHYYSLELLLGHLVRVAEQSGKNRMQIHNLAIVFGPTLFGGNGAGAVPLSAQNRGDDGGKKKGKTSSKSNVKATTSSSAATAVQSNSRVAFNMIMQGQIVEYFLKHYAFLFKDLPAAE